MKVSGGVGNPFKIDRVSGEYNSFIYNRRGGQSGRVVGVEVEPIRVQMW